MPTNNSEAAVAYSQFNARNFGLFCRGYIMGKAKKPRMEVLQMIERGRDGEDAEDVGIIGGRRRKTILRA